MINVKIKGQLHDKKGHGAHNVKRTKSLSTQQRYVKTITSSQDIKQDKQKKDKSLVSFNESFTTMIHILTCRKRRRNYP